MKKTAIKIPTNINIQILEEITEKINNSNGEVDIQLPLKINYTGFGLLPHLFLILFTWMRNKKGNIIIPINIEDDEVIKDFTLSYYGYIVLITFWRHCGIVDENGISIKPAFKNFTSQMKNRIDHLSELPNNEIMIPCFDHYSSEMGLSHWFYNLDYKFIETPSQLDNTVHQILSRLSVIFRGRVIEGLKGTFDTLSNILWELLRNTDEHAIKDHLGETKLLPNTRGLFLKLQRSSKRNFISNSKHRGLENYFDKQPETDHLFILEISVFDSGPGLAKKYLGRSWNDSLSIDEQTNTIKKCLIKGNTSVIGNKGGSKGFGLDQVLNLLSEKKGFLKIRSRKSSVYRDLIQSPYKSTLNHEDVELLDWNNQSSDKFSAMSDTEGTLITLAYPLI